MPTNDFLPFAIAGGANVESQAAWAAEPTLVADGFAAGIAPSAKCNKAWRQGSVIAAAIGSLIADQGYDALDDGNLATLTSHLALALGLNGYAADTGAANAYACTLSPALAAHVTGLPIRIKVAHDNTGASTFNPGPGVKNVTHPDGSALVAGDFITGAIAELVYDGVEYQLVSIAGSGKSVAINAQTADYVVVAADRGKLVTFSKASALAVTLPNATAAFGAGWFADFACLPASVGSAVITPTTANIDGKTTFTLSPGQSVRVVSDGTNYQVERGQASLVQPPVFTQVGTVATGTTQTPQDNTKPQSSEGDQYMSLAFTPKRNDTEVFVDVVFNGMNSGVAGLTVALFRDAIADADSAVSFITASNAQCINFRTRFAPGTFTAGVAVTFKVRAGGSVSGTTTFNGSAGTQWFNGVMASSITVSEYLPN